MKTRCYRNECERVLNQFRDNASVKKAAAMFRYLFLILFSSNGPLGVPIRDKESRTRRMLVLVVGGQLFDVVGKFRVGSISLVWDTRTLFNFALISSLPPTLLPHAFPSFLLPASLLPPSLSAFLSSLPSLWTSLPSFNLFFLLFQIIVF